jgi:hypothetical protein
MTESVCLSDQDIAGKFECPAGSHVTTLESNPGQIVCMKDLAGAP